jgi:ATP-dependent RNA helicase DDX31/DBP7
MTFTLNIVADPPVVPKPSLNSEIKNSKSARKRKRDQSAVEQPSPSVTTAPTSAPAKKDATTRKSLKPLRNKRTVDPSNSSRAASYSSRNETANATPDDLERAQRAAYLAEFHARPLELDRRAGATTRLKAIIPRKIEEETNEEVEKYQWSDLALHARLVSALQKSLGPESLPTPIQRQAIPLLIHKEDENEERLPPNVFIHSATGSGKTYAYLLPTLQSLMASGPCPRLEFGTRCLILCPTRELATQTTATCEQFCRTAGLMHMVTGCLGSDDRAAEKVRLRKGLGILVATPGRFLDHLTRTEALRKHISQLQWIILDEVDRLFDSGLGPQVQTILNSLRDLRPPSANRPWRSVCVSATVTEHVQIQVKDMFAQIGDKEKHLAPSWTVVKGSATTTSVTPHENSEGTSTQPPECLTESSPPQLVQSHVTCSAKLRLTSLVAFLLERVVQSETTVVFVSTCAAVDFYHALFNAMPCILPSAIETAGIFGQQCSIFKLHGQVSQAERPLVVQQFQKATGSRLLLATDVAARGLNLPAVDWIVQYDPPGDVADYVHRAGRVARAGGKGQSLLFVLPAEKDFVSVLEQRGCIMSAMALTGILNTAAGLNKPLTEQGVVRGGGTIRSGKEVHSSRLGEAFCLELQHRLEECVLLDDRNTKAAAKPKKQSKGSSGKQPVSGQLMELARSAFLAHVRAYPTKEKAIRHIFSAKALHLGHVARSFALKEPPKKLVAASQSIRKRAAEALDFADDAVQSKKSSLSFDKSKRTTSPKQSGRRQKSSEAMMDDRNAPMINPGRARSLLMANAAKLQSNGLDAL